METIEEIIEIFDIKEFCLQCNGNIKKYRYSSNYPYYLQNITTNCIFYYPKQIYTIDFTCINGHQYTKEYIPSDDSDQRYKIKYKDIIWRQHKYMALSYNSS